MVGMLLGNKEFWLTGIPPLEKQDLGSAFAGLMQTLPFELSIVLVVNA